MPIRFITQKIHSLLDYPVALSLMAMPFLLGLGQSNPLAFWLSFGTGIAALVLTVFTNHETGLIRMLPYSFHLAVDGGVGVLFATLSIVLGFTGIDLIYYLANAAAVLTVVGLHKPADAARIAPSPA